MKEKLLKGDTVGDMTYKVHLDGYNLVPYLTGQVDESPRESFLYVNDDQQLTGLRYDNWKLVFMGNLGALFAYGRHVRDSRRFWLARAPQGWPQSRARDGDRFRSLRQDDFDALVAAWLPLTYAVNGLNHSMGQPDLYPFVLAPTVMGKLRFVHGLIHGNSGAKRLEASKVEKLGCA